MQYISESISRLTAFKRRRTPPSNNPDESSLSLEVPQKRFKLDYAYNIVAAPIIRVYSITRGFMTTTTTDTEECSSSVPAPPPPSQSVSVQTTPPPLSTTEQRLALRKHTLNKSTIHDVIQLEQREKYRQLLQKYTHSASLYNGNVTTSRDVPRDTTSRDIPTTSITSPFLTSTPARHLNTLSPPSSDSGTGSGSEASGPVHLNKRTNREAPKNYLPTWRNPFDDKWLKNWHKVLTENITDNEKLIKETKKHLDDAKTKGDLRHDNLHKLVGKAILGDISEDEAIGDELESFPPLTDAMLNDITKALSGGTAGETLVDEYNIALTRKDLNTLKDLSWLNDEVINFYFNMLMERSNKCPPTVHIFNTFFYPRLLKVGHKGLARWTRKVDLFAVNLIMIPIHLGMHWCLATIDTRTKTISYYDSLLGDNQQCVRALRDYIAAEHLAKKKTPLDINNWNCVIETDLPEQLNGCDCGVFACKYADYLSQDKNFDFDQSDMPYFRRRMVWEMVNKTLL